MRFGKELFTDIYLVDPTSLAQCNIRDISEIKQTGEDLRTTLVTAYADKTKLEAIMVAMGGRGKKHPLKAGDSHHI
jgi:hypothetical protein